MESGHPFKLGSEFTADISNTSKVRILVLVDDRELRSEVVPALVGMPNLEVRVQRLLVGDFQVEDKAVFERKTVTDFATSMIDGRLFRQARRLMSQKLPATLILEGRPTDLSEVGVSREALQGAMVALTVLFRLPILRSPDPQETARLIGYAAEQVFQCSQGRIYSAGPRPKGKKARQLGLLQSFPGVGADRARRLLEHFGSIRQLAFAHPSDVAQVPGIGPKTAESIRDLLNEESVPYRIQCHVSSGFV